MSQHDVWFAIPSASPEKCRKVLPIWRAQGYKVAVLQNFEAGDIPADRVIWRDRYPGWAASVNILCREVVPRACPLVVTGGDDMLPDPKHTAQDLARQFFERFPDGVGVMQPHGDEFMAARRYCGSPFLGRGWFERMYNGAGPMYAGYHHNYADNELFWLAKGMGVLWERPDLTHFHEHFTRDGHPAPTYWETVRRNDLRDCLLYYARVHEHFPGHAPSPAGAPLPVYQHPQDQQQQQELLMLAEQRLFRVAIDNSYAEAIAGALQRCASAGQDPVAIYGLGLHTQVAGSALREPPVRVACFIDDNQASQGRTAWNIPVVSRERALAMGVKAVVLSGNSVEDALWARAAIFRERGIPVHRLYAPAQAHTSVPAAAHASVA